MVKCPVCKALLETAREAIVCWLGHEPDLPTTSSMAKVGRVLKVSRERVRQIYNSIEMKDRQYGPIPGEAPRRRYMRDYMRRYRQKD